MKDIKERTDIKIMVNEFYGKVRADEMLAPIFATRVDDGAWEKHLERMVDFWGTILLFQGDYKGNAFPKHVGLNIGAAHFDRWLLLFQKTVDEHFYGKKADEAKERAAKMAQMFSSKLQYFSDRPNLKPLM